MRLAAILPGVLLVLLAGAPMADSSLETVIDATETPAPGLDPMFSTASITRELCVPVFDQLATYNENFQLIPDLATSWKATDASRVWTLTLARGIKFQDGQDMTSADVVASIRRYVESGVAGGPLRPLVASIKAVDPYTVQITLTQPAPNFMVTLANPVTLLAIMPAKYAQSTKPLSPPDLIGTGPYRIKEWVPDQYLDLERFAGYTPPSRSPAAGLGGDRTGHVQTIRFQVVQVQQTRLNGLQGGTYQYAEDLPYAAYPALRASSTVEPFVIALFSKPVFLLNQYHPPLNNVWVRRALVAALDFTAILKFVTKDNPVFFRSNSSIFYPQQTDWYVPDVGKGIYDHPDVASVRADLAKAGYHGEPIVLLTNQQYGWNYDAALPASQQWQAAGINVKLTVMTWPGQVALTQQHDPEHAQQWDISTSGFTPRIDPSFYNAMLILDGATNWGFTDPQVTAAMDQGVGTGNAQLRQRAYATVQKLVWTQVPFIIIGDTLGLDGGTKSVTGYRPWYLPRFWLVR